MQPNEPNNIAPNGDENVISPQENNVNNIPEPPITHWYRYFQDRSTFFLVLLLILIPIVVATILYRYDIEGLFKKQGYYAVIVDAKTNQPLINAQVKIRNQLASTNDQGVAYFKSLKVGYTNVLVQKLYYENYSGRILVSFTNHRAHLFGLKNIGIETNVSVINQINRQPIKGAVISALNNSVATNSSGQAIINLPPRNTLISGVIKTDNYNDLNVAINQSTSNKYQIIQSGQVFYTSKINGTSGFYKSNVDGTKVQLIIAGGSATNAQNTSFLQSRDYQYIAFVMPDNQNNLTLYVFNSVNNKVIKIVQNPQGFVLNGWTNDGTLVFTKNSDIVSGATGNEAELEALNLAKSNTPTILDKATTLGFDAKSFGQQLYSSVTVLSDNYILYSKYLVGTSDLVNANPTDVNAVPVTYVYSGAKPIQQLNYSAQYSTTPTVILNSPSTANMAFVNSSTNKKSYFEYANTKVKPTTDQSVENSINNPSLNSLFYLSPSRQNQAWSLTSGNQTTVYVGDSNGQNGATIASLPSDYRLLGWYTNKYLLLIKDNNSLYIMSATGSDNQSSILNISPIL